MSDDFARLGQLVSGVPAVRTQSAARRLAEIWEQTLGGEVAANSRPRSLTGGRLVVATSSAVWAQTLQLLSEDVVRRLNAALGERAVERAVFRPAGWDPGGGAGAPAPLAGPSAAGSGADGRVGTEAGAPGGGGYPSETSRQGRPAWRPRQLSEAEERAVGEVLTDSCDEELGRVVASAMRAYLSGAAGRRSEGPDPR
jgi:hypothetical protein